MINIKEFISAMDQIAEEKGLDRDEVKEVIEQALAAAYKKDYGERGQSIKVELDSKSGTAKFFQSFLVVSEDMLFTEEEIEALEAERLKKQEQEGDREAPTPRGRGSDSSKEDVGKDVKAKKKEPTKKSKT